MNLGARFNRWWVIMWAASVVALVALVAYGASPGAWLAAAVFLFFIPEGVGLIRRGDGLPPLTMTVRRYVPRWAVLPAVWGIAALALVTWSPLPRWGVVAIAVVAGWLTNHFDVTFDGPGE